MSFFRRTFKSDVNAEVLDAQTPSIVGENDVAIVSGNIQDADTHIKKLRDQHRFDPYMDIEKLDAMDTAIASGDLEKEAAIETSLIAENSPYAEVRTAVSILGLRTPRFNVKGNPV